MAKKAKRHRKPRDIKIGCTVLKAVPLPTPRPRQPVYPDDFEYRRPQQIHYQFQPPEDTAQVGDIKQAKRAIKWLQQYVKWREQYD